MERLASLEKRRLAQTHLPLVLNLLLLLALLQTGARLSWNLVSPPGENTPVAAKPAAAKPAAARANPADFHLFGEEPKAEDKQEVSPITTLDVTLLGIFYLESAPEKARAMILDKKNQQEDQYQVGQWLMNNQAQVTQIDADRVLISHAGRLETLRMPMDRLMGGPDVAAPPKVVTKVVKTKEAVATVKEWREKLLNDPNSVYGRVRTHFDFDAAQNFKGVVLNPGNDPDSLQRVGVRAGDRVTHINGFQLSGKPEDAIPLIASLGDMKTFFLTLEREDQIIQLQVPLKEADSPKGKSAPKLR
ncbi:MAG: hypothetical protein HQL51_06090 [Magnetococcales bacterium]|nr:hypothetical protein [Magnetococcales bacterium]